MTDYDPFGDHKLGAEEPTGEDIPLNPGEKGVPTWDQGHETRNIVQRRK